MSKQMKAAIKSPKTTLAAVALIVTAVGAALTAWTHGAQVDWGVLVASITAAVGFFFTQDADAEAPTPE